MCNTTPAYHVPYGPKTAAFVGTIERNGNNMRADKLADAIIGTAGISSQDFDCMYAEFVKDGTVIATTQRGVTWLRVSYFEGSGEATDQVYAVLDLLRDPRLANWAQLTDNELATNTVELYNDALQAFDLFVTALEQATEE